MMQEVVREEAVEDITAEDLTVLNDKRVAMYALLARLYQREVDMGLLAELRAGRYPLETGDADADEGYRLIASCLSNVSAATLDDLARDFARTFIGQGSNATSAAYPYESVYTSEKRIMMQDARDEMLALLRSEGLDKDDSWCESEDHIALELEFMQVLAARTGDALRAGDEDAARRLLATQKNVMEDHLAVWTPVFTADVRKFAKSGLYQGLARVTDGYVHADREFLEALAG